MRLDESPPGDIQGLRKRLCSIGLAALCETNPIRAPFVQSFLEEAAHHEIVQFVRPVVVRWISVVPPAHVSQDSVFVANNSRESNEVPLKQRKNLSPHFWQIILGMEKQRRFALLRLHGRDVFEVRVGDQPLAESREIGGKRLWIIHIG